ncbi:hypothetical protein RhiirC2_777206 [Rhizophagus irregularis]|uniref:Uncharacterized protein n=1 Tax=Rhizophagus irregularis TaxID=588596 RepID=A0A2N1NES2_9GLOM|nr:hypothetical protein RhiirC2_777206 [Rhizophagus irregularis]
MDKVKPSSSSIEDEGDDTGGFEESGTKGFEGNGPEEFEGSNTNESEGILNKLKY